MGKNSPPEIGRAVNLAQTNGGVNPEERLQRRLAQSRVPSTQTQTNNWVSWNGMAEMLGQPFDSTKIPISKLEQMRRDNMLSLGLMLSKVPLIRAPWYIKSSDAQRAAFIDGALRAIYGRLILGYTNSFDYGFSAIVKRFEYSTPDWTYIGRDDVGSSDPNVEKEVWPDKKIQALVWKPFMALSPKTVAPHWNSQGEFAGIDFVPGGPSAAWTGSAGFPWEAGTSNVSGRSSSRVADIPLDWAMWATNEKDSVHGSLWGYPRLGYAYRYWWSYWYKFGLADRAFEKWSDPPVVVFYPTDIELDEDGNTVDLSSVALDVAEQLRSGANVAMPGDVVRSDLDRAISLRMWAVEQMKSEANFDALNTTFEYLDVQKLRAVLVPEQAVIEGKGGTSSRNVAATMGDLFQESQAVVMQEIDDIINRYMIPQLLEANFGPGGPSCTKVTTGFDPQDLETMRLVITGFANADPTKLPVDLRELLDRLGVPTLSHAAFQAVLDKAAKDAAAAAPPPTPGNTGGPGKPVAKTTKLGEYVDPVESIDLDQPLVEEDPEISEESEMEKHFGLMERLVNLIRREDKVEKTEPQEVKLTFAVEVEEPSED